MTDVDCLEIILFGNLLDFVVEQRHTYVEFIQLLIYFICNGLKR